MPYGPPQPPYDPYGQPPVQGPPNQPWPAYPPASPPRRNKRTRVISIVSIVVGLIVAVVVRVEVSNWLSGKVASTLPAPSSDPQDTYVPGLLPTTVPGPPAPATLTLPATAGPLTEMAQDQAQGLENAEQPALTDEQTALGGPLKIAVYTNDGSSGGSLTAIVMANATGALPTLGPVVSSGGYQAFLNSAVQPAGMQDVVNTPITDGAQVCGAVPESGGALVGECLWVDDVTFCIVVFAPAITADVTGDLDYAEYDTQQLHIAFDTP